MTEIWFGQLPTGWVPRRIKTISPVMRGASPRPIDDPIYFDDEGEFAWVRISDVTASSGQLIETIQRLSDIGASKSVKLHQGKLFLSIAGSVGKPCITGIKACIHDGFVYFPYLSKASQKFLYWIFESRECFSGLGKLGTQLNLNTETVGNISIPFPPIETQKTIADFLDRETAHIDQLIEKKLAFIKALGEREEGATRRLLAGEYSRAEARKPTPTPWLYAIPEHWQVVPLRHLVRISTGSRDTQDRTDDGMYPFYVRSMNIERIDTYSYDEEAVLTSGDGAGVGKVFHHVRGKYELHQRMYAFTQFKGLSGHYFFYFLKTFFHLQMTQWSAKSTVDSVRMPFLKSMLFAVPPRDEQETVLNQIETSFERTSKIIAATEQSINRLRELRAALITATVTGQLDVTTWRKQEATNHHLDKTEETTQT